jgi:hypothetical protein
MLATGAVFVPPMAFTVFEPEVRVAPWTLIQYPVATVVLAVIV